ncbi:gag polyprotein [Snakehead retrovirus]|nr:gag polyprotein [Snakehead retrovirus]AAC54860.1 gag polyprotein [Snakehead retrovirus]
MASNKWFVYSDEPTKVILKRDKSKEKDETKKKKIKTEQNSDAAYETPGTAPVQKPLLETTPEAELEKVLKGLEEWGYKALEKKRDPELWNPNQEGLDEYLFRGWVQGGLADSKKALEKNMEKFVPLFVVTMSQAVPYWRQTMQARNQNGKKQKNRIAELEKEVADLTSAGRGADQVIAGMDKELKKTAEKYQAKLEELEEQLAAMTVEKEELESQVEGLKESLVEAETKKVSLMEVLTMPTRSKGPKKRGPDLKQIRSLHVMADSLGMDSDGIDWDWLARQAWDYEGDEDPHVKEAEEEAWRERQTSQPSQPSQLRPFVAAGNGHREDQWRPLTVTELPAAVTAVGGAWDPTRETGSARWKKIVKAAEAIGWGTGDVCQVVTAMSPSWADVPPEIRNRVATEKEIKAWLMKQGPGGGQGLLEFTKLRQGPTENPSNYLEKALELYLDSQPGDRDGNKDDPAFLQQATQGLLPWLKKAVILGGKNTSWQEMTSFCQRLWLVRDQFADKTGVSKARPIVRNEGPRPQQGHSKIVFGGNCRNCGKAGHMARDCWAKGGGQEGKGPRQNTTWKPKSGAIASAPPAESPYADCAKQLADIEKRLKDLTTAGGGPKGPNPFHKP